MSDQIYRYRSIYNGSGSSYFADDGSSSYGVSNPHSFSDPAMYSVHDRFRIPTSNFGEGIRTSAADPAAVSGLKRSAEALYHQTLLGSHSIGQTEALFSTNSLVKHPRFEIANNLPIYPQRPGEKDCAHYMMTRTCKFGDACKFDHPIWVPEGGNPDWKEIPFVPAGGLLPERPGEPDCPYYMKTHSCKYGFKCKFNHSVDKLNESGTECAANSIYPEWPSESICSFYAKTGQCKFGATCKFHHPKDVQIQPLITTESGQENTDAVVGDSMPTKMFVPVTPALLHNSKGLPIRMGETDCPFYLKTGSCKYGAMCRYNHPERTLTVLGHSSMPSAAVNLPISVSNAPANFLPNINQQLVQTSLGATPTVYPQRPGQAECDFYMKNGQCSFGEKCKFHHPIDRSALTSVGNQTLQQHVKLTLAGLPRREGVVSCPFYMKTGTCKYGATCRFDHPPPGEAVAMAAHGSGSATAANTGGEEDNGVCPEELQGSAP